MKLTADYHTHTQYSHGEGTVEDNIQAAVERGLETVGIADHSVSHFLYGVKRRQLNQYLSSIEQARHVYRGRIEVKTGIELNLTGMDGSVDMPEGYRFDTVIMGYHKAVMLRDFKAMWAFLTAKQREKQITEAYRLAVQRCHIDIVAHPGYGVPVDYFKLAGACADYGVLFEINNKHTDLTAECIRGAASTGVSFVISSDAHRPVDVGKAPHALQLVQRAGLSADRIVNITED